MELKWHLAVNMMNIQGKVVEIVRYDFFLRNETNKWRNFFRFIFSFSERCYWMSIFQVEIKLH